LPFAHIFYLRGKGKAGFPVALKIFALAQSYQFAAPNINIIHSHRVEDEYYYVNLCSPINMEEIHSGENYKFGGKSEGKIAQKEAEITRSKN
jgi:hypothetical protein